MCKCKKKYLNLFSNKRERYQINRLINRCLNYILVFFLKKNIVYTILKSMSYFSQVKTKLIPLLNEFIQVKTINLNLIRMTLGLAHMTALS